MSETIAKLFLMSFPILVFGGIISLIITTTKGIQDHFKNQQHVLTLWRIISGVAIALGFINIFIGVKLDDM